MLGFSGGRSGKDDDEGAATVIGSELGCQLEQGLCAERDDPLAVDGRLHAVRRRLSGLEAVCGAGLVKTVLPGRFEVAGQWSCVDCAQSVGAADAVSSLPVTAVDRPDVATP